ncbi:MAG: PASTA domain-containing protein [Elusimicrobiota bacterium]
MAQTNPPEGAPVHKKHGMGFWGVFGNALWISLLVSIVTGRYILPLLDELLKQKVEVPNLRGAKVDHAKTLLESKGLFIMAMGESHDNEVPAGDIASQTPLAGSVVDKKSTVTVVLSKGKPKVRIPVLFQLPLEDAKLQLAALGLAVGNVESKQSPTVSTGRIISCEPQAGTDVDKGTSVNLVVSEGVKAPKIVKVSVPDLKGKTVDAAQSLLSQRGLVLGKITKKTDENADFDIILDQNPKPGASVVKGSGVSITINAEGEEE